MLSDSRAPFALIATTACINAVFTLAVIVPVYAQKGASVGDFLFIMGIASIFMCLLEIPSGYCGDVFSRKKNLIIGHLFWIAGHLQVLYGFGFFALLRSEMLFAIGLSLFSGTSEAYLYDLLKRTRSENKIHKYLSLERAALNLSALSATLIGSFVFATYGLTAAVTLNVVFSAVSVLVLLLIPDVPESKRTVDKKGFADILTIVKRTMADVFLRRVILMTAFYGLATGILFWCFQPLLMATGTPIALFGIFTALNQACRVFWSAISARMLDKSGAGFVCVLTAGVIFAAFAAVFLSLRLSETSVIYVLFFVIVFAGASFDSTIILSTTLINRRVVSQERATVISLSSMVSRCIGGIVFIGLKPLFDFSGIYAASVFLPLVLFPVTISAALMIKTVRARQSNGHA